MEAGALRELVRRWMTGDKAVADEIAAMSAADQKVALKHIDGAARRSATVKRLRDELNRRLG